MKSTAFIVIIKIIVSLVIFYDSIIIHIYPIKYLLQFLFILLNIALFWYFVSLKTKIKKLFPIEVKLFFLFVVIISFTGLFVSINKIQYIDSIKNILQYLTLLISVYLICLKDKKIDFIFYVFLFVAICIIYQMNFHGVIIYGRLSISDTSNINQIGIMLIWSIISSAYFFQKKKWLLSLICIIVIFFSIQLVILSGSRQSFICSIVFLLSYFIFCYSKIFKKLNYYKKIIYTPVLIVVLYYVIQYIVSIMYESILYQRLFLQIDSSVDSRTLIYLKTIDIFKQNPIIGVGYDQLKLYINGYSHSTYAELLACCGLVGFILYFIPFVLSLRKLIYYIFKKDKFFGIYFNSNFLFCCTICFLLLGFTMIWLYDIKNYIFFGILFYYVNKGVCYDK